MKTVCMLSALITVLFFCDSSSPAQTVKDGYPTQEARKGSQEEVKALAGVLNGSDFRALFARPEVIEDRVARRVSVFDGLNDDKGCVEVAVNSGTTLQAVLEKVGMGDWHGKGTQIIMIKQREIMQSPRPSMTPEAQRKIDELLKTIVAPGDFVYLPVIVN